jgi:hypothetical protein
MKIRRVCLVLALSTQFPAARSQEIAATSHVTVSKARISVRAQKVSLRQLLDEIRQAAGISLSAFPGAEAEEISATINDAPLEQGLRTLLGGYDSMFLYSSRNSERADLTKVWIYRKGQGTGIEPASLEALAGTKSLREKLNDPDPAVRARAFAALLNRPGIEEKEAVIRAVLAERDDNVRAGMIESLRSSGLQLQPEFWGSLSADPSEHIRLLVLDALEGTSQIRDFAALALTDPSPHVKLRAKEILDALGTATAPAPPCEDCVKQP